MAVENQYTANPNAWKTQAQTGQPVVQTIAQPVVQPVVVAPQGTSKGQTQTAGNAAGTVVQPSTAAGTSKAQTQGAQPNSAANGNGQQGLAQVQTPVRKNAWAKTGSQVVNEKLDPTANQAYADQYGNDILNRAANYNDAVRNAENEAQQLNNTDLAERLPNYGAKEILQKNGIYDTSTGGIKTAEKYYNENPIRTAEPEKRPDVSNAMSPKEFKDWREAIAAKKNKKRERTNRMVMAIGDALRHMGKLYYTIEGAVPQKYNYGYPEYEAQREERERYYAAQKLKQDALQYQREQDAANLQFKYGESARDQANKDRAYTLELGKAEDAHAKAKADVDKAMAQIANLEHEGKYKEAQALKAQVEAEWAPKLNQATLELRKAQKNSANASAANSYASAEYHRQQAKKAKAEYKQVVSGQKDSFDVPSTDKTKMFRIHKSNAATFQNQMIGLAKRKGWISSGITDSKKSKEEMIAAAYEHYMDKDVQDLFNRYGTKVDSNYREEDDEYVLD